MDKRKNIWYTVNICNREAVILKLKKLIAALLCAVMLLSFTACGSTPKVAITVDGKDYGTGEYLAYLLDAFQQVYYNGGLYYYAQQGTDIWEQTYTYNDKQVKLDEYLKLSTVDTVIRQKALENKLKEENVAYNEQTTENAKKMVDAVSEKTLLTFGVSKESYEKMCMAYYRNELSLFLAHYDKGGSKEVAETDVRTYFDENYISYKLISISQTDSNGTALSDEKQAQNKEMLQKYLDMYQKSGDFNAAIAQYNYDTADGENKTLQTLTDKDTRTDADAKQASDSALAEAVKSVPVGKAQIVDYDAGGTKKTSALILRLDPESGDDHKTYYEDSRQSILLALKFDEFDEEIKTYAKTLQYDLNSRAYKMCDPKDFVSAS